jgi:hypothetical protein
MKIGDISQMWWHITVISSMQEAEIRRIMV